MIVAGCDVGSLTTKAVILNNTRIISHALIPSSFNPEKSAPEVMDMALSAAGLTMKDIGPSPRSPVMPRVPTGSCNR